jgi:hypothetical protein
MEQAHRLCTVLTSLYIPYVDVGHVTDLIKDFTPLKLMCLNSSNIATVSPAIGQHVSICTFSPVKQVN